MRPTLALLTLPLLAAFAPPAGAVAPAASPAPPAALAESQSATKPAPFPIKYVDQGQFDPKLKGMLAPEGFHVEVAADDPVVVNPVGLTFGPDGTMYVMEWTVDPITGTKWFEFKETFRYRDGSTKQVATMRKFVVDPVKTLTPDKATGSYPEAKPIIAEELPSSILYHDGWLYTTGRGTVRRYKRSRPNGPWDVREVIAQGFCGFHHHQVSGLTVGNDGKLYITSGDDDNFVEGSDGSRTTVLRTGAVFRCNPDGSQMETYSLGYRNPYRDLAYDDKFRFLHADNDNEDGSKFTGCRLMHVAEESDYGWRLRAGARCCRPDLIRGAVAGELPGKMPPMLRTGRGSPAGLLIYNDTRLPEQYRGLLYYPDVFRKVVRAYKVRDTRSTMEVTHEFEFLKSPNDPLFRPCQMVTGPDGAIYVCDWRTDSGGAGRLSGDGSHGRIYRLKWVGTAGQPALPLRGMDSWAKLLKLSDADLVDALDRPDMTDRVEARKELVRRAAKPDSAVVDMVRAKFRAGTFTPPGRLVALGVLTAAWSADDADFFRHRLQDADPDVRRLAAEALGLKASKGDAATHEALTKLLHEENLGVRRAAVLAVGRVAAAGAADALVGAWRSDDGRDVFLTDAYLRALERVGKPGMDALLVAANSGSKADLERVAGAFTSLRTRAAANALPDLLANVHLSAGRRVDLLQSYTNYMLDPALPVEPVLAALTAEMSPPPAVTVAALSVAAAAGQYPPGAVTAFILRHLDSADPEVRIAAVQAAEDTRLSVAAAKLLGLMADPKLDAAGRTAVLRAVRAAGGKSAVEPLVAFLARNEPAALKIEALRALATFSAPDAQKVATALLDQPDPKLLEEAVATLGGTKAGAKVVGDRFVAGKLPRDLFPRVSEILSRYPADPALVALSGEVRKGGLLVSLDPTRTEEIRKLVLTKGDPVRGKGVYLNTAVVACATCHRLEGVGGQVGPDLTRVWDTQTVDKLLESILTPHKEIKEGYMAYKAVTSAGQVVTGLKVLDTPQAVTLRDATGRDIRIAKDDLDELTAQSQSLMPDNTVSQLSFDQFIDLLAFLKSQSAQESLRGAALEFQVAAAAPAGFQATAAVETSPTPLADKAVRWQARSAGAGGTLDLAGLVPPTHTTPASPAPAVYALAFVYSAKPQKVTVAVAASDGVKVWAGGKLATASGLPPTPTARKTDALVEAAIPAGWSPLLVKLAATHPAPAVGVQVRGDGLRLAGKPE